MRDVAGKVAVITGAASGIGRGMAESFAAADMKVVLSDVEEEALTETTDSLRNEGADVHGVVTDVSKAEQVQALAEESVKRFGAVHVLCNNAGIGIPSGPSWETNLELEGAGARTKVSVLCPGFVATKIMDSERNRPADRPDASPMPTDPRSEIYYDWFRGQLEKGLDPRAVGDQVLSAIREERFYILTHPDWNYMIEHRVKAMLDGQNPAPMPPPGTESLLERLARLAD